MIKEEEIKFYRENVINMYVDNTLRRIQYEEKQFEKYIEGERLKHLPNYKQCKRCGEVKKLNQFYKNPLKSKGVFDYCKECAKKRAAELKMTKYKGKK